jgi:hypothetical protein
MRGPDASHTLEPRTLQSPKWTKWADPTLRPRVPQGEPGRVFAAVRSGTSPRGTPRKMQVPDAQDVILGALGLHHRVNKDRDVGSLGEPVDLLAGQRAPEIFYNLFRLRTPFRASMLPKLLPSFAIPRRHGRRNMRAHPTGAKLSGGSQWRLRDPREDALRFRPILSRACRLQAFTTARSRCVLVREFAIW